MKAILIKPMALALLLLTAPVLYAGDMLQPVKISKAQIAGQIFEDYEPLVTVSDDSVTLASSHGTVTQLNAGDSVIIPGGWTGTWDTPGCTKIYAIHAPDKNL